MSVSWDYGATNIGYWDYGAIYKGSGIMGPQFWAPRIKNMETLFPYSKNDW